jgi:hypothetical protein
MNIRLFTLVLSSLLLASAVHAESSTKQIALNASTIIYGTINKGGMSAAIQEIKTCYDGVRTRDHFIYCLSMDIQAKRFDSAVAKRSETTEQAYFSDAEMDERVLGMQRWYPSTSQLNYEMNQLMNGLELGTKAELARAGSAQKK